MIKVVIVDDQEMIREGLKMVLSLHTEIEVIGEACNGQDLLELLLTKMPEVILMDIRMPVMDGIEATKIVKEKYPNIKIIILTTFNEDEYIFDVLKNGADGYILKDSASREIIEAIKTAYEGNILLNPKVTLKVINALNSIDKKKEIDRRNVKEDNLLHLLTQREQEVVEHIMQGKSNKVIGRDMFVTEGTVKNYVSKILEKLQLNNRAELILYLQKHN
jgi:DNA-binding NarL/FixJ family response regulator